MAFVFLSKTGTLELKPYSLHAKIRDFIDDCKRLFHPKPDLTFPIDLYNNVKDTDNLTMLHSRWALPVKSRYGPMPVLRLDIDIDKYQHLIPMFECEGQGQSSLKESEAESLCEKRRSYARSRRKAQVSKYTRSKKGETSESGHGSKSSSKVKCKAKAKEHLRSYREPCRKASYQFMCYVIFFIVTY